MGLEAATYINDLVITNPLSSDLRRQGDDHLRLIKTVLKTTLPNASRPWYLPEYSAKTGAYTVTSADDNKIIGGATSGGAFSITLPVTVDDGFHVTITKSDSSANALTVVPTSGTINGEASIILHNLYDAVNFVYSGTTWFAYRAKNSMRVRSITADHTVVENDFEGALVVAPASANATITLPAAASYKGRSLYVKRDSASYDVIIDGNASETIDGATTFTLSENLDSVLLVSTGAGWFIATQRLAVQVLGQQTLWIPANAMYARQTNGAEYVESELSTNKINIKGWNFDASTTEYVQFPVQMPKSWDEGPLYCQFLWKHGTTTTNFDVRWGIQAVAIGDADNLDAAFGTAVEVNDTGGTADYLYRSAETAAMTVAGSPAAEELVIFQSYREASDGADTLAIDATLIGIRVHYTIDAGNDD